MIFEDTIAVKMSTVVFWFVMSHCHVSGYCSLQVIFVWNTGNQPPTWLDSVTTENTTVDNNNFIWLASQT
jgi:hypothetical protein